MPRIAPRVPEPTDLLCEQCGYVLNGLPDTGRCPECGKPIIESVGNERIAPVWEGSNGQTSITSGFLATTARVLFQPTHFYRTLQVRGPVKSAERFARLHWWISAGLLAFAGGLHAFWFWFMGVRAWYDSGRNLAAFAAFVLVLAIAIYLALDNMTKLAAYLTNWEATYRGLRLPYTVVLRGLYYHAAHYLPIAVAAVALVAGYQILLSIDAVTLDSANIYLYVLSGLVIMSAGYLFNTYWIGMRNMMYANR